MSVYAQMCRRAADYSAANKIDVNVEIKLALDKVDDGVDA